MKQFEISTLDDLRSAVSAMSDLPGKSKVYNAKTIKVTSHLNGLHYCVTVEDGLDHSPSTPKNGW